MTDELFWATEFEILLESVQSELTFKFIQRLLLSHLDVPSQ